MQNDIIIRHSACCYSSVVAMLSLSRSLLYESLINIEFIAIMCCVSPRKNVETCNLYQKRFLALTLQRFLFGLDHLLQKESVEITRG